MPTSEEERPIVVRSFPATDQAFAEAAGDALRTALAERGDPATLHDVVERRLRSGYPNARIHMQDPLGHLGAEEVVWYAYRDGRIRETDARRERLYSVVAAARRTVRDSEAAMEHAREVSRAAGFDKEAPPLDDEVSLPPRPRLRPRPPSARREPRERA